MSYLEVFYNPSSNDWDAVADADLEQIDFTPETIICLPLKSGSQLKLFKDSDDGQKRNLKFFQRQLA